MVKNADRAAVEGANPQQNRGGRYRDTRSLFERLPEQVQGQEPGRPQEQLERMLLRCLGHISRIGSRQSYLDLAPLLSHLLRQHAGCLLQPGQAEEQGRR